MLLPSVPATLQLCHTTVEVPIHFGGLDLLTALSLVNKCRAFTNCHRLLSVRHGQEAELCVLVVGWNGAGRAQEWELNPSSHCLASRQALPIHPVLGFPEGIWQRIRQSVMEKLLRAASDKPKALRIHFCCIWRHGLGN